MDIDEIPNLTGNQFPYRINIAISTESKRKLDFLRREKGKDIAKLVRTLLNDLLKDVELPEAG